MILGKDITAILTEASTIEEFSINTIQDNISKVFNEMVDSLDEHDEDIIYTEEMIPVMVKETGYYNMYIVEYDMVNKLMESYNIDAKEAIVRLCEHNSLSTGDMYVMVESIDVLKETSSKLKRDNDVKTKKDMANAVKTIEDLKTKGVNIIAKKSKKKKKK
ncbi:MAG: hypothetical protein ACRCXT_13150 [Paraclostridium sp.]